MNSLATAACAFGVIGAAAALGLLLRRACRPTTSTRTRGTS
jgi:hypothetical protein